MEKNLTSITHPVNSARTKYISRCLIVSAICNQISFFKASPPTMLNGGKRILHNGLDNLYYKILYYKLKMCGISSQSLFLYSWNKAMGYDRRTCLDKLESFLKTYLCYAVDAGSTA